MIKLVIILIFILKTVSGRRNSYASVCQASAPCMATVALMKASMNERADPCYDFYDYACGRYGAGDDGSRPTSYGRALTPTEYLWRIEETIESFLKQRVTKVKLEAERNAIRYYKSCVTYGKRQQYKDRYSIKFLQKVADEMEGFSMYPEGEGSSLEALLARHLKFTTHSMGLFQFIIERNLWNATRNQVTIMPPTTLVFGDKSYFTALKRHYKGVRTKRAKIRRGKLQFVNFLKTFAKYVEPNVDPALLTNLAEFEQHMAKINPPINMSAVAYELGMNGLQDISVQEFQEKIMNSRGFDWFQLFHHIADNFGIKALTEDEISKIRLTVTDAVYFHDLADLISRTRALPGGEQVIRTYLTMTSVAPYLCSLSATFSKAYMKLTRGVDFDLRQRTGCHFTDQRHLEHYMCHEQSKLFFGPVVSRAYLKKFFSEAMKTKVESMAERIRQVFVTNILKNDSESSWLDDKTRQHAIEKAEKMLFAIGYPDLSNNVTMLEEQYGYKIMGGQALHASSYLDNSLAIARAYNLNLFRRLDVDSPSRTRNWQGLSAIDVNAQYLLTGNIVQLPAASCTQPYFSLQIPQAMQWGGVSQPLAHESTHGFDSTGRFYDKYGQVRKWWTAESIAKFNQRAKCLVEQYESFDKVRTSYRIDHSKTLDENIADVTGMKVAYLAFRDAIGVNIGRSEIPGLNLNNEQLFFVMTALGHCDASLTKISRGNKNEYKSTASHLEAPDVHSSAKHRIWGMAANLDSFAKAFNCPRGARMNPVKKCQVW